MAGTEVTGAAAVVEPEVTPTEAVVEEPETTEEVIQDSAEKLREYEEQVRQLQENLRLEAEAKAEAQRKAEDALRKAETEEKIRKGHQRETGEKLKELAALKKQLANQTITDARMEKMERLVGKLAEVQLDPETVKDLNDEIDNERIRRENEQLKAAQQAQQQQQRPNLTPEWKRQLHDAYFSEYSDVDPLELQDTDWLNGASEEEGWKERVRQGYARVRASHKPIAPAVDVEELTKRITEQVAAQFQSVRTTDQEALKTATTELKTLKEQLAEQKAVAEEALNRSRGMDRGGNTAPAAVTPNQRSEMPSDNLLYGTPEEKAAYRLKMNDKNLRNEILKRAGLM